MNRQKRVLAIHDISCFGRCSLTVALPIISSAGIETTILPTSVLSTHTGGFEGFTFRDLTSDVEPIIAHWDTLDLNFDAVYTGWLGSTDQVDMVARIFDHYQPRGAMVIVDPVMGDNGALNPFFSADFPGKMRSLCEHADVIMPNLTEATLLLDEPYIEGPYSTDYIEGLLGRLGEIGPNKVVLTGVFTDEISLGAACFDAETGKVNYAFAPKIEGYYHGTGDVFGSALVSALLGGVELDKAISVAVQFTVASIQRTYTAKTDIRFGVNFEDGLSGLKGAIASA